MTKAMIEKIKGDEVLKGWIRELQERNKGSLVGMDSASRVLDQALNRSEFFARLLLEIEVGP